MPHDPTQRSASSPAATASAGDGASAPASAREIAREFWAGATKPSAPALAITLVLAASLCAGSVFLITPDFMVSRANRYFADGGMDDRIFMTATAFKLSRIDRLPAPAVFIFGTSSIREGITSEPNLADLIAARCGIRPIVHNLAIPGLTLWEMASLADMLPKHFDGVVVFATCTTDFWMDAEKIQQLAESPTLGFITPALEREAAEAGAKVPPRTGIYAWDNRGFFLARIPSLFKNLLWEGPQKPAMHHFLTAPPIDKKTWNWTLEEGRMRADANLPQAYLKSLDKSFAIYSRMCDSVAARGNVAVAFLASPINPEFIDQSFGQEHYQVLQRRIGDFARSKGAPFWDLNETARINDANVYNGPGHLRTADAEYRWTAAVADRVAELLKNRPMDPPAGATPAARREAPK